MEICGTFANRYNNQLSNNYITYDPDFVSKYTLMHKKTRKGHILTCYWRLLVSEHYGNLWLGYGISCEPYLAVHKGTEGDE